MVQNPDFGPFPRTSPIVEKARQGFSDRVLYLGDSLTRGIVGQSYISFLPPGPHKNAGRDGDTALGAEARLTRYRRAGWYSGVTRVVVAVGTNDILQPFLTQRGAVWRLIFRNRRWTDPAGFEAAIRRMVEAVLADGKDCVLLGLPEIQLLDYPRGELRARNEILRTVAADCGIPFADVLGAELAAVPEPRRDFTWGRLGLGRLRDILVMGLLPGTKEGFSRRRALELTVDGVHFNAAGAALAAGALEACL